MQHDLKGKVALVTGGSRGIGAAIAKRLAKEGASVAISYSTSADKAIEVVHEIEKYGCKALAVKADQSNPVETRSLITTAISFFGKLDILVNNAGIFEGGTIDDPSLSDEMMHKLHAVNIDGVVSSVREAVKHMPKGGRIILIGSIYGERVPRAGVADYSATKAALAAYTRGWARDLGKKEITVNMVQPGQIDTDMNPASSDFAKEMAPRTALGRYGKPEDIANAVAFLSGPEASYITGAILNVDGGFNA